MPGTATHISREVQYWSKALELRDCYDGNDWSVVEHCKRGIPPSYRGRVWRWLVMAEWKRLAGVGRSSTLALALPNSPQYPYLTYHQLLAMPEDAPHLLRDKVIVDIDKDIERTGIQGTQEAVDDENGELARLRRVLVAYAQRNPVMGYCQGRLLVCFALARTTNISFSVHTA